MRVDFPWSTYQDKVSVNIAERMFYHCTALTMGNDRHVTDVGNLVHEDPNLGPS